MINRVMKIITKYQDVRADQIHKDSHLRNDFSLNSYEIVEMICDLEDLFGIEIPEEHIWEFRTVGDIVAYLEKTV